MSNQSRRWTEAEDSRLFQQVKVYPQNLKQCFMVVAEVLDRTPGAVANRWYTKVSKDPKYAAFVTVSSKHKALNRKNSEGQRSNNSVFQRILRLLRLA